jgi:signal transduction histidine kinase
MLHEFLQTYRNEILELSEEKTKTLAGNRANSEKLKQGLPLFYEQLITVLEQKLSEKPHVDILSTAALHGKEFLNLGYSLSHVVHSYGSMCQAITELATQKNANISPYEFNILNGCLDVAIASAVSEFQYRSNEAGEARELKHLGFLAHELRNALSSATVAQEMIRAGLVGVGGSTAAVLEANLVRMRNLIDRSLSEVRMRADSDLYVEKFYLSKLFDQIVVTAKVDASKRNQTISSDVDWKIEVEGDRQFLLSAIANLVQNALKYSKTGGKIELRGKLSGDRVIIEVEDECGGIQTDKISTLFKPFTQENEDRSGLGLGLSITQRAVHLSQGTIKVRNKPGSGCTFIVDVPQKIKPTPSNKNAVKGQDSVQPNFKKKT